MGTTGAAHCVIFAKGRTAATDGADVRCAPTGVLGAGSGSAGRACARLGAGAAGLAIIGCSGATNDCAVVCSVGEATCARLGPMADGWAAIGREACSVGYSIKEGIGASDWPGLVGDRLCVR